jgi:hypothetical protein
MNKNTMSKKVENPPSQYKKRKNLSVQNSHIKIPTQGVLYGRLFSCPYIGGIVFG